jgi:hypothetical protein
VNGSNPHPVLGSGSVLGLNRLGKRKPKNRKNNAALNRRINKEKIAGNPKKKNFFKLC